jgi:hypothetical protein
MYKLITVIPNKSYIIFYLGPVAFPDFEFVRQMSYRVLAGQIPPEP